MTKTSFRGADLAAVVHEASIIALKERLKDNKLSITAVGFEHFKVFSPFSFSKMNSGRCAKDSPISDRSRSQEVREDEGDLRLKTHELLIVFSLKKTVDFSLLSRCCLPYKFVHLVYLALYLSVFVPSILLFVFSMFHGLFFRLIVVYDRLLCLSNRSSMNYNR